MKKNLTSGILFFLTCSASAGVIRHDIDDLFYRNLAQQSQFDAVGDLLMGSNNSFSSRCSGTLISSLFVLTAAHCLDNPSTSLVRFSVGSANYFGSSWIVHQNWNPNLSNPFLTGWDIALLKLDKEVKTVQAANLYTGKEEIGKIGYHVGFGTTGNGLTGATKPSGTKRAGQNEIDEVNFANEGHDRILWNDFDAPAATNPSTGSMMSSNINYLLNPISAYNRNSGTALELEMSISPGDSGGGYFLQENGLWYLAGVHSFGASVDNYNTNFGYGDFSGSTRVSSFTDWIESSKLKLMPVPLPTTLILLFFGLCSFWFKRLLN